MDTVKKLAYSTLGFGCGMLLSEAMNQRIDITVFIILLLFGICFSIYVIETCIRKQWQNGHKRLSWEIKSGC